MKSIYLKNYKLIDEFEFDLNKINLVVGENSCGKSSFLRSFQLLKQSSYSTFKKLNTNLKGGIDFGEYSDLISKKEEEDTLTFSFKFEKLLKPYGNFEIIGINWEYSKNLLSKIIINMTNKETIELFIDKNLFEIRKNNKIIIEKEYVKFKNNCFPSVGVIEANDIGAKLKKILAEIDLKNSKEAQKVAHLFLLNDKNIYLDKNLNFGGNIEKEELSIINNFSNIKLLKEEEIKWMINLFLEAINKEMKMSLNNFYYIGPIRSLGERYNRVIEDDNTTKGFAIMSDIGKQLYQLRNNNGLKSFNEFIKKSFDFSIDIRTLAVKDKDPVFFYIEIEKNGLKNNLLDVGTGYSQILPILYTCFRKERRYNPMIFIEQPELHLHPKMQSDLLNFILKLSKENPKIKFIIETHSPLIIDNLGKHIFIQNYETENINIFLFNKNNQNLEIKKTKYKENGLLEEWPLRFFSPKKVEKW